MLGFKQFTVRDTPNVDHWEQTGDRLGSNPGGRYHDPSTGDDHYVKFYNNPQQARSEVAASHIYHMMGLKTLNPYLVNHHGQLGVASKWDSSMSHIRPGERSNVLNQDHARDQLARSLHAAVLTKNWDAAGNDIHHGEVVGGNIQKDSDHNLVHGDLGGTFRFRAQGGPKEYGSDIGEVDSLLNQRINPVAHDFFRHITPEDHRKALDTTSSLDPNRVHEVFKQTGVTDPLEHASHLISRRDALIRHFS